MIRIQRLIGIRPSARPVRGPLSALGALLALGCASAMAHDPAETSSADRVADLRKQVEEMQERLDELRANLEEAQTEEVAVDVEEAQVRAPYRVLDVDAEDAQARAPYRVAVRGDGKTECDGGDACAAHEKAHKKVKTVVIEGEWGDWGKEWAKEWGDWSGEWAEGDWGAWAGEDLKEKIHAHMGQVHEHLKHLDEGGDDDGVEVEGEATIEIIIQTDDGPPRHIKKRIPIDGKGYKMLWLGDDEEGEGDQVQRWKAGGHRPFFFHHGDGEEGDRNVHVLKLKELLEGSANSAQAGDFEFEFDFDFEHGVDNEEHREHLMKLHELLEGKLKPLQKIKVKQSKDGTPLLIEVQPQEAHEEASSGAREVV